VNEVEELSKSIGSGVNLDHPFDQDACQWILVFRGKALRRFEVWCFENPQSQISEKISTIHQSRHVAGDPAFQRR
jgi:hypothetical protein